MTVPSAPRSAGPFVGNGVTTAFPFTFKVFSADDVAVYYTDSAGTQSLLTTNYTVALNADQDATPGGTVTYPTAGAALSALEQLALVGDLAYVQGTDITNAGRFLAQVIENVFDYLTILAQQLLEKLGRTLSFPIGDSTSGTLPSVTARAGNFLAFDALGNPIAAAGTTATPVSAFMATVLDDVTAAAARATLGAGATGDALFLTATAAAARTAIGAPGAIQSQTDTAFTTAGILTAYTLTPAPAIAAYAANQTFFVKFHVACGAAPTLAISGLAAPPNLVKQNADGTYSNLVAGDIPINHRSRVTLLSAAQAWVEILPNRAPAFSAHAAVTQSITTSTDTKVTLGTVVRDTDGCFAASRFTANAAGDYQFNGVVRCVGTSATIYYASIFKNGTEYQRGQQLVVAASGNFQQLPVSAVVFLNVGDYVELYGQIVGTSPSFDFNSVAVCSSFSGAMVRAA